MSNETNRGKSNFLSIESVVHLYENEESQFYRVFYLFSSSSGIHKFEVSKN